MDDELMYPIRNRNGTYENPFETFKGSPGGTKFCRFMCERMRYGPPAPPKAEIEQNLPVLKPDLGKLSKPPPNKIQYMWIGHASVLYQVDGWNLLSDPVWGERCSPSRFFGPKRYRPTPLDIDQLPNIDAVVISHNHYDHLCTESVTKLNLRFGNALKWFVPEGLATWFHNNGCKEVTELTWWQSCTLEDADGLKPQLDIICTPAQHWSLRTGFDRNESLWSSWTFKTKNHSVFFSGDTGYCDAFKVIGKKYGPFDLAAIAIGAYCPRWFMEPQHVDPQQAFQMHKDLKSKLSFGIHWGTFGMGSTEPYMEPKQLIEDLQTKEQGEYPFVTVNHGAIHTVD